MYKKIILYSFFITLSMIFVFYFFIFSPLIFNGKNFFFEDKLLKNLHLNRHKDNLDIVFVGSSTTYDHISTNKFKENGFNVYNYGKPANFISGYPTPIHFAINAKPKIISLQIRLSELYLPDTKQEITFKTYIDKDFYDEANYSTLNEFFYENIKLKELTRTTLKYYLQDNELFMKNLSKSFDREYLLNIDCNIVYFRRDRGDNRDVIICNNGDAIVMKQLKETIQYEEINYNKREINYKKIELLNKLIQYIKSNNIEVAIILEPSSFNKKQIYDINKIKELINIESSYIADFSNYLITEKSFWADKVHFNSIGRSAFTAQCINFFKTLKKYK